MYGRVYGRRAVVQATSPPLHKAGASKGTTSADPAWAPTASQELPEWHYLAKPSLHYDVVFFA